MHSRIAKVIDTSKAEKMGIDLEMVQSGDDREDNIYVRGRIPAEILTAQPNIPRNLPDTLKAKIVDPKSFEQIPIIDLALSEAEVIKKLTYSCEVVGFMQVVGHGVPLELQEKALDLQKRFFQLSQEKKDKLRLREESLVRGYFGRGGEERGLACEWFEWSRMQKLSQDLDQVLEKQVDEANGKDWQLAMPSGTDSIQKSRKDCKEALDMNGVPWAKPKGGFIGEIFGQPSQMPSEETEITVTHMLPKDQRLKNWITNLQLSPKASLFAEAPQEELPGFREVMEQYALEMFKLSKRLLELMALILGKPRDFFHQFLDQPVATHRLLHYWPIKDFNLEIGVGEHTDYGLLTILKQEQQRKKT
eukprot:g1550.t1